MNFQGSSQQSMQYPLSIGSKKNIPIYFIQKWFFQQGHVNLIIKLFIFDDVVSITAVSWTDKLS